MIWLWLFLGCYVAPMVIVIFAYSVYEHDNPFNKEHIGNVLIPFRNLYITLVIVFVIITLVLIEFWDFCEDVGKAFKKNFC